MKLTHTELSGIVAKYPNPPNFDLFIETGTHKGCTVISMDPHFDELHTIEITEHFYNFAQRRYTGNKINFHLGDSTKVLPDLLEQCRGKPAIFFLDAHWSCDKTGKGEKDVPLLEEVVLINKHYNEPCIIVVDDYRLFNGGDPYVNWSEISEKSILASIDSNKVIESYAANDRFILLVRKV